MKVSRYLKYLKILLIGSIIFLFSGCVVVDRGNFGTLSTQYSRSAHNFYSYDVIDTSKEDIGIPKPPHTPIVERFEVRDGDCSGLDCSSYRERYELQEQRPRNTNEGDEYWYTWDIYFPKDYKTIAPGETAVGQLYKSPGAMFMFIERKGLKLKLILEGGTKIRLVSDKDLRGKWHTIVVNALWSTDPKKGFFKVWIDGKKKFDKKCKTSKSFPIQFKYGIYRSHIDRYFNSFKDMAEIDLPEYPTLEDWQRVFRMNVKNIKVPTQVVYYSNVRRANTKEGLFPKR